LSFLHVRSNGQLFYIALTLFIRISSLRLTSHIPVLIFAGLNELHGWLLGNKDGANLLAFIHNNGFAVYTSVLHRIVEESLDALFWVLMIRWS
jgi:hypothetical protein